MIEKYEIINIERKCKCGIVTVQISFGTYSPYGMIWNVQVHIIISKYNKMKRERCSMNKYVW